MNDQDKIKEQLIEELVEMRQKVAKLKTLENIHKQIEEKLRKSEKKYRLMVENANEPILVAQDGILKFANPKAVEVIGYQLDELTSRPFVDFIHPDDRDIVIERHMKRLKGNEIPQIYPFRIIDKNGNVMWAEINVVLIKWEERPATLFSIRDITERKHAEELLKESEGKYSTIVEQGNDGIAIAQHGKVKFANSKLLELFGFSLEEILEKLFIDFIAPKYRKAVMERYKKRLAGEKVPTRYELELNTKDGRKIPVEINASLIEYEGKPAELAIIRDISERKRIETALRESEKRYRGLYESSIDGIASASTDGTIVDCNQAFADILGYTKEELNQLTYRDYVPSKWHDMIEKNINEQVIPRGYSDEFEVEYLRKDGTIFPVSVRLWLIKDKEGKPIGRWGIVRDITEHKRAEEAICRERDNLINIMESMEDGVYIVNQNYDIEYVNPIIKKEFGFPEERKCYEYFHDREEECPWCKNQEIFAGKTVRWEWYSSKTNKTYDLIDTPLKNPDGSISKLEIFRDITKRKEMESQLIESEKKYRTLIEQSLQGITILQDGFILFANPAFAEISGYTIEELLNFSPEDARILVHPEDRDFVQEWIRDRFMGKSGPSRYDFRITRKDGSVSWLDASVSLIEYQGKPANQVTFVDITKRKHAEEEMRKYTENLEKLVEERTSELKESEARYRGLYESSIDGIAFTDMEQKIVDCNQAFADMLGYTKEELYQLTLWDVTPSKWFDMNKKIFSKQVFAKGYSVEYEKEYIKKDETIVPISARAWVIKDKEGTPTGSWGIVRDITERKKVDQMKSKFINVAAHELRTPLSALKAHVDLLKIKINRGFWSLPEEVNKKINIIARNADRLSLLINNLLDYTRLEAGTLKMNSELSSLENLAIETVKEVNLLAKKHNHEIKIITPESLPLMYLDKEKLKAIFNNLLSNAIKYTPKGGTINVLLTEVDDNIHIMVKDTGIGIAEDELESVFLPFHVADVNTTDRLQIQPEFERTGLGLAITKEYVKMHGGTIWAESRIGEGSTFHVVFPKNRDEINMEIKS